MPERDKPGPNRSKVLIAITDDSTQGISMLRVDPTTRRLKTTSTISSTVTPDGFTSHLNTTVNLSTANTQYLLPASEQASRKTIILYNKSDTSVYYGGSAVTTSTGILLESGEKVAIDSKSGLYAVCGSANKDINVLEMK
tara:strand:- start:534 stop:953 length:420 start_codon:yes stop_codon:yes gene_type:complete